MRAIAGSTMLAVLIASVASYAMPALAAGNPANNNPLPTYTLLEPLPCIPAAAVTDSSGNTVAGSQVTCAQPMMKEINFQDYVRYVFNLAIALASAAAVFMITYGGFQYMTTDAWKDKEEGLTKIRHAVEGLLLILSSFLLLRTIDPRLVNIPSTLVPQLNINYSNQSGTFSDFISNQITANDLKVKQTLAELDDLRTKLSGLQNDQDDLQSQILYTAGLMGSNDPAGDANKICADTYAYGSGNIGTDTQLGQLCAQLQTTNQNIVQNQSTQALDTSSSVLTSEIEKCMGIPTASSADLTGGSYGNTLTYKKCQDEITTFANDYAKKLQTLGQPADVVQKVYESAKFARAMVDMNTTLRTNMDQNPYIDAALKSGETVVLSVTTASGAALASGSVIGTGVGAAAGFTAGSLLNATLVEGPLKASQAAAAQKTIAAINDIVKNSNITDPTIKQQLQNQANSLITGLTAK